MNLKIGADLENSQLTKISANSVAGTIHVKEIVLTSDATTDSTTLNFADSTLKDVVSYSGE